MSLFPAYAAENEAEKPTASNEEWLRNSSFTIDVNAAQKPEKKHKKRKKKETKDVQVPIPTTSDDFTIDRTRTKEFFSVNTISRPSVPKYDKKYRLVKKKKPAKFRRYYAVKIEKEESSEKSDENFTGFKQEETLSQETAAFNRRLAENPLDVAAWLEYVRFQDFVFQFEKTYRKGSIAKGMRVTAERKMSILDKALTHLPGNEEIIREKLNICVSVYPADELYVMLSKLVDKEKSNIILWQGLIESRQCSMSHCNTKTVISLYTDCLSTLHQLRRAAKLEKSVLEENILRMLYQCGLFLKQSGLFELLWTLLKMYLDLNIAQEKNIFSLNPNIDDKQLLELEEVVLKSQLPIHELWLRIEKLRESCHWFPFLGENCEDPQRIVFPEDVSELIHPITMPGNTFKLTATILNLLKIPVLPARHTTARNLGLDYVPWALDSIEAILPIFLNLYPLDLSSKHYLDYTQKLAVGPQYIKPLPGQEEYLVFILEVMMNCINSLQNDEKTAVSVWWFRFQRVLYVLEKENLVKMSKTLKKKLKNHRKSLLKSENNNVILYREFALVEYDLDSFDSCVNILETALKMHITNDITNVTDYALQSSLCSLYRTLVEFYLNKSNPQYNPSKSLEYLIKLTRGTNLDEPINPTEETIKETTLKFKHHTLKLLQTEQPNLQTAQHFLPQFPIDWIICNGWIIHLTKPHEEFCEFIEEIIPKFTGFQSELLLEFYVAVLFKIRVETPCGAIYAKLDEVLFKSIELYPNNLFFLAVLSKEQSINCSMAQNFWKVKNLLMKTGHALPNLFLVLISFQRVQQVEASWIDTFTGDNITMDSSLKNRTYALFKALTSSAVCAKRCGIIWRLYLQFLHENYDPTVCRNAYYSAVEELPWLKALYIDAAIYVPAELPQIQDLLLEKQLRLHVTPEELDILRD